MSSKINLCNKDFIGCTVDDPKVSQMASDVGATFFNFPLNFPLDITLWEVSGKLSGKLNSAGAALLSG